MNSGAHVLSGTRVLFVGLLAVQAAIALTIPLVPYQNDAAWYYMNVHFVETGQYIHERVYQFTAPSQLYPFLGYSLLLYVCDEIAASTGLGFAILVKLSQLVMYGVSAFLVVKIVNALTARRTLSYLCGLFFLGYYSHFSFVYTVMSETYAIFLLVLSAHLFVRSLSTPSPGLFVPLFIVAGAMFIVKPVFLPAALCFVSLIALRALRARVYPVLYALPLVLLFPAMQMAFSQVHYGNTAIRAGVGWNLWNRVVWHKLVPSHSEALTRLERIYEDRGQELRFGFWWEVARDLSSLGYTELATQQVLGRVALDGIREFPLRYVGGVLLDTYLSFTDPVEARSIHRSQEEYLAQIPAFANDRQHLPLVQRLSGQALNRLGRGLLLTSHEAMARAFERVAVVFHNPLSFVLFLVAGLYAARELFRSRGRSCLEALAFWLTASSIVVCSNLAEIRWDRFTLPAVAFALLSCVVAASDWIDGRRAPRASHQA